MKKIYIFLIFVVLPIVLIQFYTRYFEFAGGFLEAYRNHFKFGFLTISILGTIWLIVLSKKQKHYVWLGIFVLLLMALLFYFYVGYSIINIAIGF